MPRILGVDIPANKKLPYSLRYIYGLDQHVPIKLLRHQVLMLIVARAI